MRADSKGTQQMEINNKYSNILNRMAYLQLDLERFNDILKINNIYLDSNVLKVIYKLRVGDNGIALYDECRKEYAIPYTRDISSFLIDYTNFNGLRITHDRIDTLVYLVDKVLALKTEKFETYVKSFNYKHISENYIEVSSFKINNILGSNGKNTLYLVEDMGVKVDKEFGITHNIILAETEYNVLKSFRIVDVYNCRASSISSLCNIDNTKAIKFSSTILPEFEHKTLKKMVIVYNMISEQRIEEICNNIKLLSRG